MYSEKELEAQEKVAQSFEKDVLKGVYDVKNIKNVYFNGSYLFVRFATKSSAEKAQKKCRLLNNFQYNLKDKMFQHRHELIGTP